MSDTSQLQTTVDARLLDDDGHYDIYLVDQTGQKSLYEKSVKLDNPYDIDYTKYVPNNEYVDLPRFFELASEIILDAQVREGIAVNQRVQLVEDFNPEELHKFGDEVITWKVMKRMPANMSTKGTARPQRKPLYSHVLNSSNAPNKVVVVQSMPTDNDIEFAIWSKIAPKANRRALWLEKLFRNQSWAFTSKGVERFYWKERGTDTMYAATGQKIHVRPLRFFVRLREFESSAYPAIRNFDFELNLNQT